MLLKYVLFAALADVTTATVWLAGINIAGFDFGCGNQQGSYSASGVTPPLLSSTGIDGAGQMSHFTTKYGLNVFRIPVCWQYLTDTLGGSINTNNFGVFDQVMQACLKTGAYCVIDVHNYGRWNNQIVGQSNGAVTNAHFASLWWNIAAKYSGSPKVVFGLMNEPHDVDVGTWATTVQWAVNSIRGAGATSQMILLPGSSFTGVGTFVSGGSAAALAGVSNPGGSKTNLIFDVHQYLDSDGSGTQTTCTTNGLSNLQSLATWLRSNKRQAFLTETGGGTTNSCYQYLCAELDWMNYNSDVYLGWIGWAAGSFSTSYELSETPTKGSSGSWVDPGIVSSCVAGKFSKGS